MRIYIFHEFSISSFCKISVNKIKNEIYNVTSMNLCVSYDELIRIDGYDYLCQQGYIFFFDNPPYETSK